MRSGTAACDSSAILPLVVRYYRWDTEEREDLSKEAEDEAVVPGTPAVLLLWSHGRYYRCGAVLPLVAP